MLGLAGCTAGGSTPPSGPGPSSPATADAGVPDPDRVALDRAREITTTLLAELTGALTAPDSRPDPDPGGRFLDLHTAHLTALERASGDSASDSSSASSASPTPELPTVRTTRRLLRRHETAAQRELAHLGQEAASGALARLLASMAAGIAAHLAVPITP